MSLLAWNDKLSVGITEFDEQHKQLFALINQLHDAMLEGRGNEVLDSVLAGLIDYSKSHFTAEERMMRQFGFPGLAAHKEEHEALSWKVRDLKERLGSNQVILSAETMAFLKTWLTEHILGTDKEYTAFLSSRGVK